MTFTQIIFIFKIIYVPVSSNTVMQYKVMTLTCALLHLYDMVGDCLLIGQHETCAAVVTVNDLLTYLLHGTESFLRS